MKGTTIYTIGHSTLPVNDFIEILKTFGIKTLVDIRTIPRSRYNPQFNEMDLQKRLESEGIEYIHLKELGGLRHTTKSSINTAWRNASFRGFADYMQTEEFTQGIEHLIEISAKDKTAIMCAEAVPWRCHRSLIGDALLVRDVKVEDIMNKNSSKTHQMTPWAKVNGHSITYPENQEIPKT